MILFREATLEDISTIVEMLADDPLGSQREHYELPLPASYLAAFTAIDNDPHNELVVACNEDRLLGFMQITFIPYLT